MPVVRLLVCLILAIGITTVPLAAQDFPAAAYNFVEFSLPNAALQQTNTVPTDVEESGRMSIAYTFYEHRETQFASIYTVTSAPTQFACNGTTQWTSAQSINRHGATAGWCYTDDGAGNNPVVTGFYRSTTGQVTILAYPGARHTEATTVNNHHNVGGFYIDAAGASHGFFWKFSTKQFTSFDAPFAGASATTPLDMNNADEMVGIYHAPLGQLHGFLYKIRTNQWAGIDAPGAHNTLVLSINDFGTAIGGADALDGSGYAFVYEGGVFTEMTFPFLVAGRLAIHAINNSEQVVGIVEHEIPSDDPTGNTPPTVITQGFRATPLAMAAPAQTSQIAAVSQTSRREEHTGHRQALRQAVLLDGCPGDGWARPGKLAQSWALCRRLR